MTDESSARHGFPFLAAGQAQKELAHNEALALIDAAANPAVEEVGLDTPPAAPAEGQCWIVGDAPTAEWAGRAGAIACWTGSGWRFVPPIEGMQVWVGPERLWAVRDGGLWRPGEVRGSALLLGGNQVVGPRLESIAAPVSGAIIDTEARAAISSIIERLVAHGLIGG